MVGWKVHDDGPAQSSSPHPSLSLSLPASGELKPGAVGCTFSVKTLDRFSVYTSSSIRKTRGRRTGREKTDLALEEESWGIPNGDRCVSSGCGRPGEIAP